MVQRELFQTSNNEGPNHYDVAAPPAPFVRGSETSRQAAARLTPHIAGYKRRVLDAIEEAGASGMTDEQIHFQTGIRESTARAGRVELVQSGEVVDSGTTRLTASGRSTTVWVAANHAITPERF